METARKTAHTPLPSTSGTDCASSTAPADTSIAASARASSVAPSRAPSTLPSHAPSVAPSRASSVTPSRASSTVPANPSISALMTSPGRPRSSYARARTSSVAPSHAPSALPSRAPSVAHSRAPSVAPSRASSTSPADASISARMASLTRPRPPHARTSSWRQAHTRTVSARHQQLSPVPSEDPAEPTGPIPSPIPSPSSDDDDDAIGMLIDIPDRQPDTLPASPLPPLRTPGISDLQEKTVRDVVRKEVIAEKKRQLKAHRNEHLRQVRLIFNDVLNAPEDEDFVSSHPIAPKEAVEEYLEGDGPGPNRNFLQFSALSPYNNAWNRAVASELGRLLSLRQQSQRWRLPDGTRVATVSVAYWEDAVLEKFKRVRSGWINASCQDIVDPSTGIVRQESQSEANARRFSQGEQQHLVARQRERRSKVSIPQARDNAMH